MQLSMETHIFIALHVSMSLLTLKATAHPYTAGKQTMQALQNPLRLTPYEHGCLLISISLVQT